jgi:hypothetical protein
LKAAEAAQVLLPVRQALGDLQDLLQRLEPLVRDGISWLERGNTAFLQQEQEHLKGLHGYENLESPRSQKRFRFGMMFHGVAC